MKLALALCALLAACGTEQSGEAPAEQAVREAVQESAQDTALGSAPSPAEAPPVPHLAGACGRPVIDGDGIGAIRIGMAIDTVKARCDVVRDTVEVRSEGQSERILVVAFGGDTATVEADEGRVWRIEITSSALRTADWLGVGTPLSTLLARKGGVQGLTGEGNLFLVSQASCGLSFELSQPRSAAGDWPAARLRTLPKSTVVTRVLIIGCQSA